MLQEWYTYTQEENLNLKSWLARLQEAVKLVKPFHSVPGDCMLYGPLDAEGPENFQWLPSSEGGSDIVFD